MNEADITIVLAKCQRGGADKEKTKLLHRLTPK